MRQMNQAIQDVFYVATPRPTTYLHDAAFSGSGG